MGRKCWRPRKADARRELCKTALPVMTQVVALMAVVAKSFTETKHQQQYRRQKLQASAGEVAALLPKFQQQ